MSMVFSSREHEMPVFLESDGTEGKEFVSWTYRADALHELNGH